MDDVIGEKYLPWGEIFIMVVLVLSNNVGNDEVNDCECQNANN